MIRAPLPTIRAIEKGSQLKYSVTIGFQQRETYTIDDYLISEGDISQSVSGAGAYEIQNTTVMLKNKDYYFSRKFSRELPNGKPVAISVIVADQTIEIFSGVIDNNWSLTATELSLPVHA